MSLSTQKPLPTALSTDTHRKCSCKIMNSKDCKTSSDHDCLWNEEGLGLGGDQGTSALLVFFKLSSFTNRRESRRARLTFTNSEMWVEGSPSLPSLHSCPPSFLSNPNKYCCLPTLQIGEENENLNASYFFLNASYIS